MDQTDLLGHVAEPPSGAGRPVLVIHSWWGLTDSFRDVAGRLAERGLLVGCADLYDGRVATTRAQVRQLRGARRREPMYVTLERAIDRLRRHPASSGQSVAVVGFSMGGHWAAWLAQNRSPLVDAVVLYYAARGGDWAQATSPVLAHFAENDDHVSPAARRRMERAIDAARLPYTAHEYPGTRHWFAEAAHPAWQPRAATLALRRTADFLQAS